MTARLRRLALIKKAGHIGTLDPFATGLLPVCLGRATRVIRFTDDYDKVYQVTVRFGLATDSQDLTGQPVWGRQPTAAELDLLRQTDFAAIRQAVADLVQLKEQLPPMYSAVKSGGRPLYEYARQGLELERQPRPIRIYAAELVSVQADDGLSAQVRIHCSKGTYIRSICDHLGQVLGFGGHAFALQRLACGPFRLEDAWPLDRLTDSQLIKEAALDPAAALAGLSQIKLNRAAAAGLVMGQPVYENAKNCPDGLFSIWLADQLVAVGRALPAKDGLCQIKTERVLIDLADLPKPS